MLEARRSFELVAQDFDDQHQDHRASQSDETELDAQRLAHRHRQHGQQEHSDRDEGEQPVRDVGLDAGRACRRRLADPAEAVDVHERERDDERRHQDRE